MPVPIDMTGMVFGRLTVLRLDPARSASNQRRWVAACACGSGERPYLGYLLRTGETTSCGCVQRELSRARAMSHGHAAPGNVSPEYFVWQAMRGRCLDPKERSFKNYGGRGITVCASWADTFEAFLEDMGYRPSRAHTIDRTDNQGGYWCGKCDECTRLGRPANCRWATRGEQSRNRRSTRLITHGGETLALVDWAARTGIGYGTLRDRIVLRGWAIERALTEPVRPHRPYVLERREELRVPLVDVCNEQAKKGAAA